MKDTLTTLDNPKCEVLSVLDLKDTFHSLRLSEKSEKYCGILPYFGSVSYFYQRIPIGLNISPLIWQTYINTILNCLMAESTVKQLWMIYCYSCFQAITHEKIRRLVKGTT